MVLLSCTSITINKFESMKIYANLTDKELKSQIMASCNLFPLKKLIFYSDIWNGSGLPKTSVKLYSLVLQIIQNRTIWKLDKQDEVVNLPSIGTSFNKS